MKALRVRLLVTALICATALSSVAATPSGTEALPWENLVPAATDISDPFADVPDDQYDALIMLLRLRDRERFASPLLKGTDDRRATLLQQFKDKGIDLEVHLARYDAILAERRKTAEAGVTGLDGKSVMLDGYMLPVKRVGDTATEFLLLADPASCSHSRMPMPNQTVLVQPATPLKFQHYFEKVTVKGTLEIELQKRALFLLDGELNVTSAYAMAGAETVSSNLQK